MSATPRTDKAANESIVAVYEESKLLEAELAAVKREIESLTDRNAMLHSKLEKEKETSELLATSRDEWEREFLAVTKQRDELAAALREILLDARLTLPTIQAAVSALKSIENTKP